MHIIRKSLLLILFSSCYYISYGYSVRNIETPTLRVIVLPVNSNDPAKDEIVFHKPVNSDLVIGDGEEIPLNSKITMECDATYPIQFIYTGDGMPEYTTNTSQLENHKHEQLTKPGKHLFEAQLYLGYGRQLGAYDSGKYTCRSLQDAGKAVHYYLFVFDGRLFIRHDGDTVYFRRSDPTVRIPCSVSHPNATVSLQKSVNGVIQCPLNDSITFNPNSGFQLSNRYDIAATYVCTAGYRGVYQAVQYILMGEGSSSQDSPQRLPCRYESDCPETETCLRSGNCGSPCSNSCGSNTSCRVVNHRAQCQCLAGTQGNPYSGCSQSSSNQPQQPPPESIRDPCSPFPCGTNTVCENHQGIAKCQCQNAYQGDPYYKCYRRNDPCNPNPCGPHSHCINRNDYASCSCGQGFIGTPPHCRAECEGDYHCNYNQVCRMYRCRNPCDGACDGIPNTQCRVINRRPVCAKYQRGCPQGYYGRDCSQIYERETENSQISEEVMQAISACVPFPCGTNAECITRTMTNTVLNETSEVALCQCKPGETGNADMECYPVEEQMKVIRIIKNDVGRNDLPAENENESFQDGESESVTDKNGLLLESSTLISFPGDNTTGSTEIEGNNSAEVIKTRKKCGTNAIAIVSNDGKQICSCPIGYTGLPSIECHSLDLPQQDEMTRTEWGNDLVEPEYCTSENSMICGRNAYCILHNGTEKCECMRPFTGNPEIGCELECNSDADCPSEYSCYSSQNSTTMGRCVDPCEPSFQIFFKQCGRDAFCKAENHLPACYCPQDLPYGDPSIHCKEKSWMPNHLPPAPIPSCDKKNSNCGKNAECRQFHDSKTYCVCMPGYYGDPYDVKGPGCEQGLQCRNSTQCPPTKECVNGRCLDPCREHKIQCGEYAGCSADENHKPKCICNIGTIRNPSGSCEPVKGALAERMALFRSFEDF